MQEEATIAWDAFKNLNVTITVTALWLVSFISIIFALIGGFFVRYHLKQYSFDKIKALEAELLYYIVSFVFVAVMLTALFRI